MRLTVQRLSGWQLKLKMENTMNNVKMKKPPFKPQADASPPLKRIVIGTGDEEAPKAEQVQNFKPSKEFIKAFNELAEGFSHSFRYDFGKDKILFSALTHNCGIIQLYADSTEEMEREFINKVNECITTLRITGAGINN